MTTLRVPQQRSFFTGFSTDTKPTKNVSEGSVYEEVDTGRMYEFHDAQWYLKEIYTRPQVYDEDAMDYVDMLQPVISTDELSVSSTTNLSKIGGASVGPSNGLYVRPGADEIFTVSEPLKAQVVYEDGDVLYICRAPIGSNLSDAVWQIKKVNTADPITTTWADGNSDFDNTATDLATVRGHSYS